MIFNCSVLPFPLKNHKHRKHTLRVSALQNEPFVMRNEYGVLNRGIKFELIKMIAEKENLKSINQYQSQ